MRLKEIKPGMVIHCKTKEEMLELSKHIEFAVGVEHIWRYGNDAVRRDCISINDMCQYDGFSTYDYFANETGCEITEFSDLILPELTAEETIKLHTEVCCSSCKECPLYNVDGYSDCEDLCINNPEKAIEILAQWKSEHEKKEPEIEWVYRVFGAENYGEKFFQTEVEAINRCEELAKSQKTKQYARYERVCRVKAVE